MLFRDRLREAIDSSLKNRKSIASDTNIPKRTIDKWLELESPNPSAKDLSNLAIELDTTVEYLVLGESGKSYVLDWAKRYGGVGAAAPPELSPPLNELISIAHKMSQVDLKKLIEIAKICEKPDLKTDELERTPQAKIG